MAKTVTDLLVVEGISKRFGGLWALRDISFSVREGEILGIIGPNGAGKTTLFSCITGFCKPDSGKIFFMGKDITGKPPFVIARMGLVRTFQITKAFENLSVYENVLIPALTRYDVEKAKEIAEEILRKLGLEEKSGELASNLTILERKRLELARALAVSPKLLLLDEVMAGLKPAEVNEIINILKELNKHGITIIVVEHILKAIMGLCNRVVVLDHGVKIFDGDPLEAVKNEVVIKAYLGEGHAVA